jgi:hypothetical protein
MLLPSHHFVKFSWGSNRELGKEEENKISR